MLGQPNVIAADLIQYAFHRRWDTSCQDSDPQGKEHAPVQLSLRS